MEMKRFALVKMLLLTFGPGLFSLFSLRRNRPGPDVAFSETAPPMRMSGVRGDIVRLSKMAAAGAVQSPRRLHCCEGRWPGDKGAWVRTRDWGAASSRGEPPEKCRCRPRGVVDCYWPIQSADRGANARQNRLTTASGRLWGLSEATGKELGGVRYRSPSEQSDENQGPQSVPGTRGEQSSLRSPVHHHHDPESRTSVGGAEQPALPRVGGAKEFIIEMAEGRLSDDEMNYQSAEGEGSSQSEADMRAAPTGLDMADSNLRQEPGSDSEEEPRIRPEQRKSLLRRGQDTLGTVKNLLSRTVPASSGAQGGARPRINAPVGQEWIAVEGEADMRNRGPHHQQPRDKSKTEPTLSPEKAKQRGPASDNGDQVRRMRTLNLGPGADQEDRRRQSMPGNPSQGRQMERHEDDLEAVERERLRLVHLLKENEERHLRVEHRRWQEEQVLLGARAQQGEAVRQEAIRSHALERIRCARVAEQQRREDVERVLQEEEQRVTGLPGQGLPHLEPVLRPVPGPLQGSRQAPPFQEEEGQEGATTPQLRRQPDQGSVRSRVSSHISRVRSESEQQEDELESNQTFGSGNLIDFGEDEQSEEAAKKLNTAYKMLRKAEKDGVEGKATHKVITRMAERATEMLGEAMELLGGEADEALEERVQKCNKILINLQMYDRKASGVSLQSMKCPVWDGEFGSLGRHLSRCHHLLSTISDTEVKLAHLSDSLPATKKDLIGQCKSYEEARKQLLGQVQDPAAVALTMIHKLQNLPKANNALEEEAGIRNAADYLGRAINASKSFYLHVYQCIQILRFMHHHSLRDIKVDELNVLHDKEVIEQETDSPNMAMQFRDFLVKLRNRNQVTRAALEMNTPLKDGTRASAASLESTENPMRRGQQANEPPKPKKFERCPRCKKTYHHPDNLFNCLHILENPVDLTSLGKKFCPRCAAKKRPSCEAKKCPKSIQTGPRDKRREVKVFCEDCKVHRSLGSCGDCTSYRQRQAKFFKERMESMRSMMVTVDPLEDELEQFSASRMVVNHGGIGRAVTPNEVVEARTHSGEIIKVVLIYDTQCESSLFSPSLWRLCNPKVYTRPIKVNTVGGPVTINEVAKGTLWLKGSNNKETKIEGILQSHPAAKSREVCMPKKWEKLARKGKFAKQVYDCPTNYSILVGCEVMWHPLAVMNNNNKPEISNSLKLHKSQLTQKLLCTGLQKSDVHPNMDDTEDDQTTEDMSVREMQIKHEQECEGEIEEFIHNENMAREMIGEDWSVFQDTDQEETQDNEELSAMRVSFEEHVNWSDNLEEFSVSLTNVDYRNTMETWNLGKEIGENELAGGENIEEFILKAQQKYNFLKNEIMDREPESSDCHRCCPTIAELSSITKNFDRQLRESLNLIDNTEEPEEGEEAIISHEEFLSNPPWDHKQGELRPGFPKVKRGRKKYIIQMKRNMLTPAQQCYNFKPDALTSTMKIVKKLQDKPMAAKEISYKLQKELEEGILVLLDDFIKRPEVKEAGITAENVESFLMYSGILLVYNAESTNTPLRLVFHPAQKRKGTQDTVNKNIGTSQSMIAALRPTYFKMMFSPYWSSIDLESFYLKTRLDTKGILMNVIFLQADKEGKPCLTGDPSLPTVRAVKIAPSFGAVDAGNHAQIALTETPRLYKENHPSGPEKLPDHLVDMVTKDIKDSFVDDMSVVTSIKELDDALNLLPARSTHKEQMALMDVVGKQVLQLKTWGASEVVDFLGYTMKSVSVPEDKELEKKMNENPLFMINKPKKPRDASRPPAKEVIKESSKGKTPIEPREKGEDQVYLGINLDRNGMISLRPRDIYVGQKHSGIRDPSKNFRTKEQAVHYMETRGLDVGEFLSFLSQDYNPLSNLNGMLQLIGRTLFKDLLRVMTKPGQDSAGKWKDKTPESFNPKLLKYYDLFQLCLEIKVPRYGLVRCELKHLQVGICGLGDAGKEAQSGAVWLISWSTKTLEKNVHLCTTKPKQAPLAGRSIPRLEQDGLENVTTLVLEVTRELKAGGLPMKNVVFINIGCDSMGSIYMAREHAGSLDVKFAKTAAKIQVNFIKMEETLERPGEPNLWDDLCWIDQKQWIGPEKNEILGLNYADLLTKSNLETEQAEDWKKRWTTVIKAPWMWLPRSEWKHMHTGTGTHPGGERRMQKEEVQVAMSQLYVNEEDVLKAVEEAVQGFGPQLTEEQLDVVSAAAAKISHQETLKQPAKKKATKNDTTFTAEVVKRQFGKEAEKVYKRLTRNTKDLDEQLLQRHMKIPEPWKRNKKEVISILSNQVLQGNGEDEMFFTNIMKVGKIHKFGLRQLCAIVGLVMEGADKWKNWSRPEVVPDKVGTEDEDRRKEDKEIKKDLQKDLTTCEGRTRREVQGLWKLISENCADNYEHESGHELISKLVMQKVNFRGKQITVLVGRKMRQYLTTAYFPMEDEKVFMLRILDKKKPLTTLLTHLNHIELGCGLGKKTYHDALLRHGFHWKGAVNAAQLYKDNCHSCKIQSAAMRSLPQVVGKPGADYTINELFSEDPLQVLCIDEFGPVKLQDGQIVHCMMAVEVATKRVHLIAMEGTATEDVIDVLERLQAKRGGLKTVIFDPLPSHEGMANSSTVSSEHSYLRAKMNNPEIQAKLQKIQIQLKVTGDNAHHQCSLAEMISRKIKVYMYNVCNGMSFRNGVHFQSVLDKMAGCINARVLFLDTEGYIHSADSFMQAAAQISRTEPGEVSELPNTTTPKIIARMNALISETRRIFTLWGSHYLKCLMAWNMKKFGKKPAIYEGDVVICFDRVLKHQFKSARRAIGRVTDISPDGQTLTIQMGSRGKGDRMDPTTKHRSAVLLLVRSEANKEKPADLDVLTDLDVSEFMAQERGKLMSAFHSEGLERLSPIKQTLDMEAAYIKPVDQVIERDLYKKKTILDEKLTEEEEKESSKGTYSTHTWRDLKPKEKPPAGQEETNLIDFGEIEPPAAQEETNLIDFGEIENPPEKLNEATEALEKEEERADKAQADPIVTTRSGRRVKKNPRYDDYADE